MNSICSGHIPEIDALIMKIAKLYFNPSTPKVSQSAQMLESNPLKHFVYSFVKIMMAKLYAVGQWLNLFGVIWACQGKSSSDWKKS